MECAVLYELVLSVVDGRGDKPGHRTPNLWSTLHNLDDIVSRSVCMDVVLVFDRTALESAVHW